MTRVWYSMCQMECHPSPKYKRNQIILVAILTTLCVTARNDFVVYDKETKLLELWTISMIKPFWCCPEVDLPNRETLLTLRHRFFHTRLWYYDSSRGIPRNTQNPGNFDREYQVAGHREQSATWNLIKGPPPVRSGATIQATGTGTMLGDTVGGAGSKDLSELLGRSERVRLNAKIRSLEEQKAKIEEEVRRKVLSEARKKSAAERSKKVKDLEKALEAEKRRNAAQAVANSSKVANGWASAASAAARKRVHIERSITPAGKLPRLSQGDISSGRSTGSSSSLSTMLCRDASEVISRLTSATPSLLTPNTERQAAEAIKQRERLQRIEDAERHASTNVYDHE